MASDHRFAVKVEWTGNLGEGTAGWRAYSRDHEISSAGRAPIPGSSAPEFRGDGSKYNPEELLVAALSACHMLWYLHLCADAGVVVSAYIDNASGAMAIDPGGKGQFTEVVLHPQITLAPGSTPEAIASAQQLHERAHERCFIARSVNFDVKCEPAIQVAPA